MALLPIIQAGSKAEVGCVGAKAHSKQQNDIKRAHQMTSNGYVADDSNSLQAHSGGVAD